MRISAWAGLHNRQADLDFVDIDTSIDTPLFLDPFAIDIRKDKWSDDCGRHLRTFFDALISALRTGKNVHATHLASHLGEANETFLGMSKGRPRGRGIGKNQAAELLHALRASNAFATGLLSELSDTELFIEGIGPDKISDLTTNVLRGPLLRYTREQAELWGMPLTSGVTMGALWDADKGTWIQDYHETIVVDNKPVLLVPKVCVRRILSLNSQEFYNHHMINYLRAEYLEAGQALVRVLKSGDRIVTKKDVKERHPKSKPKLAEFVQQHPDVLAQYKRIAGAKGALMSAEIETEFDEKIYACSLKEELSSIPRGPQAASDYHKFCIGALTFLFYPDLITPKKEREINQGRKRIDISYTNAAREGFFDTALRSPQMRAIEIPIECKNYTQDIANPELDQLAGRFSHTRGFLGFLCCRSFDNKQRFIASCQNAASSQSQFMIVFDDHDFGIMLANIQAGNRDANHTFLRQRLAEISA